MRWQSIFPALIIVLLGTFVGLSIVMAQTTTKDTNKPADGAKDAPSKDTPAKDGTKDGTKDGAKDGVKKDATKDGAKEEWLTDEGMEKLMEGIQEEWDKLKAAQRTKVSKDASDAADKLAELAPKMLKFHKADVRDAEDYKDWAADLEKQAKEYSKVAKKSSWDDAAKCKDKIGSSCGGCHKKYRPKED
ncbi:MAG: cytochrome c [Planctomycetes bacterium]|nr:cytochrome c [Planctomycetota bacterium]